MLVELRNGETYNGHLVSCDNWMNLLIRGVICTSRDGERFWQMDECYIKGNTIKYLRIPDEVLEKVKEETFSYQNRDKNIRAGVDVDVVAGVEEGVVEDEVVDARLLVLVAVVGEEAVPEERDGEPILNLFRQCKVAEMEMKATS
eukprot:CAMPEP_0185263216 /NCGR_PEP_ID=MMETSP1359-20130426/12682_1 /TAXON_ID=552665 /ORGANISM="Bigelowiella longifila, Strain CCMP242" /LENGTH=144 /DNA_ID=CAMNT_0027850507 /DNA_START=157 /DNA_END=592 /DNA_ORIENTATION=+